MKGSNVQVKKHNIRYMKCSSPYLSTMLTSEYRKALKASS